MKCYYHNDKDAVGICKNCNKGLCIECVKEIENGIVFCSDKCANEVISISGKILKTYNDTNKIHIKNGILYLVFAILFLLFGVLIKSNLKFILYPLGAGFIIATILSLSNIRKLKE